MGDVLPLNPDVRTYEMLRHVDKSQRPLDAFLPPDTAEAFVHSSINYCDEMDTHNFILDYDAIITGTAGITDHPLSNIAAHDFDTYWQADSGVADDAAHLFEMRKDEKIKGSVLRYTLHGFKVPKV